VSSTRPAGIVLLNETLQSDWTVSQSETLAKGTNLSDQNVRRELGGAQNAQVSIPAEWACHLDVQCLEPALVTQLGRWKRQN
jgi:hypothetical protein